MSDIGILYTITSYTLYNGDFFLINFTHSIYYAILEDSVTGGVRTKNR